MERRDFIALSLALAATQPTRALAASQDTIAIGGDVTEIVYALDQQHRLLARDATSTYPPEAQALPDVGYMRRLSAEGVLSFRERNRCIGVEAGVFHDYPLSRVGHG